MWKSHHLRSLFEYGLTGGQQQGLLTVSVPEEVSSCQITFACSQWISLFSVDFRSEAFAIHQFVGYTRVFRREQAQDKSRWISSVRISSSKTKEFPRKCHRNTRHLHTLGDAQIADTGFSEVRAHETHWVGSSFVLWNDVDRRESVDILRRGPNPARRFGSIDDCTLLR